MLPSFSNTYLTPDDFSVPCRLRRCEESSSSEGENDSRQQQHAEEMTCTMRKWLKENKNSTFTSPLRRDSSIGCTKEDDAELVFTPQYNFLRRRCMSGETKDMNTPIPLSKRFASFGSPALIDHGDQVQNDDAGSDIQSQSAVTEPIFKEEVTIPVKDIIKVLTRSEIDVKPRPIRRKSSSVSKKENSVKEECRKPPSLCITTQNGSFELLMNCTNEQLVLLTFLKVNSKEGNVLFVQETKKKPAIPKSDNLQSKTADAVKPNGESTKTETQEQTNLDEEYESLAILPNPSTVTEQSTGDRSFDVEALTAKTMAERMEKESLTEKLERRFYRLVTSLDDLSNSFTKCACGCFADNTVEHTITVKESAPRRRTNTDSTVASEHEKLEVAPELSTEDTTAFLDLAPETPIVTTRQAMLVGALMPDREEDYIVDTVPCRMSTMITCDI